MFQQQHLEPRSDKRRDCFPILTDPSSLCFQHQRDGSSPVVGTAYTSLSQPHDASKSATLPRSSPGKNSPHRGCIKTGSLDVGHCGLRGTSSSSPAHSLHSTPSQSPRLHRKYNGFGVVQKPGAIDNSPLIVPLSMSKVRSGDFPSDLRMTLWPSCSTLHEPGQISNLTTTQYLTLHHYLTLNS